MHTVWQDLRYAFRTLGKNPGFTAIAVLTLGLGISINSTMFAMVSGYLLRRPPVQDADRVLVVSSVNPAAVFLPDTYPVSAPNYIAWKDANHVSPKQRRRTTMAMSASPSTVSRRRYVPARCRRITSHYSV